VSLLLRINLWLVGTFLVFLTAAVLVSRLAMLDEAREDAISDARLLLESAQGARDYTTAEVEPLLVRPGGATPAKFFPQSVPAYAATQMFQTLRKKRPEFSYREATLNPTNPRDRTVAWEADVVEYFRNNAGAEELVNERQAELGRSLYLARPIRVNDAKCLGCHNTAATAPPMIVRQYGPANGFGWKLHETVGAQIVSVPLDTALARVDGTVGIVAATLVTLFLLLFAVVNVVLRRVVLKPIALLATAAESISTGQKVDVNLNVPGGDEISSLCRAFDRMRTSIEKSLAMLTARE
jgi:HAMP domain-containing protein